MSGDEAPKGKPLPAPTEPLKVVRKLLTDRTHDEWLTLRRWRGQWMTWRIAHWAPIEETEVRAWLYTRLEDASFLFTPAPTKRNPFPTVEVRPWQPNRHRVSDVVDALVSVTHLPEEVDAPSWLNRTEPRFNSSSRAELVSVENGLLDVRTRQLDPHTPAYWNTVSVPFDYDPDAPDPAAWRGFLQSVWGDDEASIAALQQWFGYVLSGRTDMQKILMLVGPTRSGKGTIARVIQALVGRGNFAGPTLASLETNFGLAPLIGRPLAVVSDARLGTANAHQVVERLLSISGEDSLTIDIKYRQPWTGKLPARFMILSNELPRFGDASGAIAGRFVILQLQKSFLGAEDRTLAGALQEELPGILTWALDGLGKLNEVGAFTIPAASEDAVTALRDLVSPISAFVRDCCDITDPQAEIAISTLYSTWKTWAEDNGHRPGSVQMFGSHLRAAVARLKVSKPHGKERHYVGIAHRKEDHFSGTNNGQQRGSCGSCRSEDCKDGSVCGSSKEANRDGDSLNRTANRDKTAPDLHEPHEPQGEPLYMRCSGCGRDGTEVCLVSDSDLCTECWSKAA